MQKKSLDPAEYLLASQEGLCPTKLLGVTREKEVPSVQATKTSRLSKGIAPLIPNLGARCRYVATIIPGSLCPQKTAQGTIS